MKISSLVMVLLAAGLVFQMSCATSKNSSGTEVNQTEEGDQKMAPMPEPALAPGHARVSGKVVRYCRTAEKNSSDTIMLEVENVLDYGSTTPVIAAGETITVTVQRFDKQAMDSKIGTMMTAVIEHSSKAAMAGSDNHRSWSLVKIE